MRQCAARDEIRRQCEAWTLNHPTLCEWHSKRDAGLIGQSVIRGKPRQGIDPADVVSGERLSLVRGMRSLGASELEVRLAAQQVGAREPQAFRPSWAGRGRARRARG